MLNSPSSSFSFGIDELKQSGQAKTRLSPEEMARLDTSINNFLNTYTVPNLSQTLVNQRNLKDRSFTDEIGGGLTAGKLMGSTSNSNNPVSVQVVQNGPGKELTRPPPTPPQSSPNNHFLKRPQLAAANTLPLAQQQQQQQQQVEHAKVNPQQELKRLYEDRIELVKQSEQEKLRAAERHWEETLNKLRAEYDRMRTEHLQVLKERDELDLKYKQEILKLEQRLKSLTCSGNTNNTHHNQQQSIQAQYERKIADLCRQFEQEKRASTIIMQTKMKSQLSVWVPKLREKIRTECEREVNALIEQTKQECNQKLAALKQQHYKEKRQIREQAMEDARQELSIWRQKLKEKMRIKLAQVENEAERKVLARLRVVGK